MSGIRAQPGGLRESYEWDQGTAPAGNNFRTFLSVSECLC